MDDRAFVSRGSIRPTRFGPLTCTSYTHIGKRPNQEDRFVVAPNFLGGEYAFFGVFDGTVKEFAAEYVHQIVLDCLLASPAFKAFHALSPAEKKVPANQQLLCTATTETYLDTDSRFLEWARVNSNHYSSCTGITTLIHLPTRFMVVGHIGDSRIIMGSLGDQGRLVGQSLTVDHKPDMKEERARIEACGGSLTYLHGGKPFIRGGDFHKRKHAMQLNYSRAFGGKDLKMYGLLAEPTVNSFTLGEAQKCLVLGSDGIWDVVNATQSVGVVWQALQQNLLPADELCTLALRTHEQKGSADNVTAVVVYFDFTSAAAAPTAPTTAAAQ